MALVAELLATKMLSIIGNGAQSEEAGGAQAGRCSASRADMPSADDAAHRISAQAPAPQSADLYRWPPRTAPVAGFEATPLAGRRPMSAAAH